MGNTSGITHHICIDTGSAISSIVSAYVRKYLPHVTIHPSSTIRLKGIGYNSTSGWISTSLHFLSRKGNYVEVPAVFHVANFISTKIITGNDILVEQGSTVNLAEQFMTFRSAKGAIPVTSTIYPTGDDSVPPTSPLTRTKHVFTIASGYQVELAIQLSGRPKTRDYYLEPTSINPNLVVSRSVGKSDSP
jgi:hypothetical protein